MCLDYFFKKYSFIFIARKTKVKDNKQRPKSIKKTVSDCVNKKMIFIFGLDLFNYTIYKIIVNI